MSAPAIIYLALTLVGLGMVIAGHGKPRSPENAYSSIAATSIILGLLYWGGFFS